MVNLTGKCFVEYDCASNCPANFECRRAAVQSFRDRRPNYRYCVQYLVPGRVGGNQPRWLDNRTLGESLLMAPYGVECDRAGSCGPLAKQVLTGSRNPICMGRSDPWSHRRCSLPTVHGHRVSRPNFHPFHKSLGLGERSKLRRAGESLTSDERYAHWTVPSCEVVWSPLPLWGYWDRKASQAAGLTR